MNKDPNNYDISNKDNKLDDENISNSSDELNEDKKNSNRDVIVALGYLTQLSVTMVAIIMVGVLFGRFLDKVFGTSPWFLLIFSLLGAAAAIMNLFNISKRKK